MITPPSQLQFGQIRPGNYAALRRHYGGDPPWPMAASPHAMLAMSIWSGTEELGEPYREYLTWYEHREPGAYEAARKRMAALLEDCEQHAQIQAGCVLDGNHRVAAALVNQKQHLRQHISKPYQTVEGRRGVMYEGRRGPRTFPVEFEGRSVLDLGTACGMNAIYALEEGATRVLCVDHDLTSVTWQVRAAWDYDDVTMPIAVLDLRNAERLAPEADLVLALSVAAHIGEDALRRQIAGRAVLYESHYDEDPIVASEGHDWTFLGLVAHSIAAPERQRALYYGRPK